MAKTHEVSSHMTVKISQAIDAVILSIQANKVPMIHGSPAIGKSAIGRFIAEKFNLKMIDLRLAQCDPTDLNGFPYIDPVTKRASYVPMDTFPVEGDALPVRPGEDRPYDGWLLFMDEFNSASVAVQAAAYKIVLDRMVGQHHLHSKVAIMCAGNLETDGAIVEQMSTALQSRMVHLDLAVDSLEWIVWASKKNFDYRITSFINFKPELLYTFKPDHSDRTYASPRTWEFVNDYLQKKDITDPVMLPTISGCITEGVTREFFLFCDIFTKLPTVTDILADPRGTRVPDEPSVLYAMAGSLANHARPENIAKLLEYIERLPVEFQVVTLRMMTNRNKNILMNPAVQVWVSNHADILF